MNTTAMETSNIDRIITKWKDQLEAQYLCISQTTSNYEPPLRQRKYSAMCRRPGSICGTRSRTWT